MNQVKILIVDDDPNILEVLAMRLESQGFEPTKAVSGDEALALLEAARFDLILTDLRMAGMDGIDLTEEVRRRNAEVPVILLTAHGSIPNAVEAMQKGAFSYLTKPFDDRELLIHIERALEKSRMQKQIHNLESLVEDRFSFKQIIGRSRPMKEIFKQVELVAGSDSTVLLTGESGTGKELFARAIHAHSHKADGPFLTVNCGAIPENLLENELFGHEKGAYTGADSAKEGYFARADGGTLFLDEIGETPPAIQVKLLRVLQEKAFTPIGSDRMVTVDLRLVAATNRDLEQAVAEGTFREDLYYRIHVIPIHIPPLRERKEDIPFLVDHFIRTCSTRLKKPIEGIDPVAVQQLLQQNWPGNVRELENRIEQAVVMARGILLTPQDFFFLHKEDAQTSFLSFRQAKDVFEKEYVTHVLKVTGGHVTNAAKMAGKQRADFYNLMKKHQIRREDFCEQS
ncbi:MAG: sigma-54-dependent Fis family transcriptional regulator [Deltaproteobacteria bacterium]|nr:sigma-54-dependent Fis family transcriptional regulator [Deltaproteobacteria bacterium]